MKTFVNKLRAQLLGGVAVLSMAGAASAAQAHEAQFAIPPQPLDRALSAFGKQSGHALMVDMELVATKKSPGVMESLEPEAALRKLLAGTGLNYRRDGETFYIVIAQGQVEAPFQRVAPKIIAPAESVSGSAVEGLVVTAQKRRENIQDVPIAISAFTQDKLEVSQIATGADLMTQVPNMTFTKTNFSGYSIQIRGIGTQAISATTDAAVSVSHNNTAYIRNRFFEQEFYDLERVEVLRGPQGTLYGRNATAGVVNILTAKPIFDYEAKASFDIANYGSKRLEGMVNVPLVEDKVALRLAGAWTQRDGFVDNEITGNPIDGRDLWSTRLSLRFAPMEKLDANFLWEHFEEKDDRLRSGKQLCHQDDRETVQGLTVDWGGYGNPFSQGCLAASLYGDESFEAPNGYSLPYYLPLRSAGVPIPSDFNPYSSQTQSRDLRVIESTVDPKYEAKNDIVELQWAYDLSDNFTLTSETSYLYDTIYSLQDFNRFNTASGAFSQAGNAGGAARPYITHLNAAGNWEFCDPQIGCADRLVAIDVSRAKSSQFSQEFRLNSNYDGPFNFSAGVNYLRYDTEDKYYVFINTLTMFGAGGTFESGVLPPWEANVSDNHECLLVGQTAPDPTKYSYLRGCQYIDPNTLENVNDLGHNYFLSKNPYKLISYAAFGEAYWNITDDLKLTAGLRLTRDEKQAPRIPSFLIASQSVGLSVLEVVEQEWTEPTGRLAIDWKPDLAFTDDTLLYASYSHGYKAGGMNPPPAGIVVYEILGAYSPSAVSKLEGSALKPKIFDPEFVEAFEVGSKNTLFDGALTANLAAFYYDYTGYQISQIIDRSAINYNFDATVYGLEFESDWQPAENFRLGLKLGYEHTEIADGEQAIDIMDRTAGRDGWIVMKPSPWFPSNCVLPVYVIDPTSTGVTQGAPLGGGQGPCENAYANLLDPITHVDYGDTDLPDNMPNPGLYPQFPNYPGFNPRHDYGNNGGDGFFKQIGGNELPNAPHFTTTLTADYTLPLPADWLVTLHGDAYYQSEAWTRVFNTDGYDKLKAYYNLNFAAIFTNEDAGLKVMAYVKNALDRDSITGAFLNSDDTGLTTNVFLTEPRLYGVRLTKDFSGGPWWTGARADHKGPFPLWIELGGTVLREEAPYETLAPAQFDLFPTAIDPRIAQNRDLDWGDTRELRVTYKPTGQDLSFKAEVRSGKINSGQARYHQSQAAGPVRCVYPIGHFLHFICEPDSGYFYPSSVTTGTNWSDGFAREKEEHLIVDFAVGKDLGLGSLTDSRSTVSVGLRYGQFKSRTNVFMGGRPNLYLPDGWGLGGLSGSEFDQYRVTYDQYRSTIETQRQFEGTGPALSWEAAKHLLGNEDVGHVDVEWAVGGGALIGRQKTTVAETDGVLHYVGTYQTISVPSAPMTFTSSLSTRYTKTTVPFLNLGVGLSYQIQRIRLNAGYRWERYFNVLDAGYAAQKDYDRTMDGPYFKVALGFGE